MLFLLWFVHAIQSGSCKTLDVEVILSIPLDKMQDADYCGVLRSHSAEYWANGLLSSCTFTQDYPQETHLQVNLKVRVDTIKLPKDAPDDSSYDFLMWYLNWLINGGKMRCMTTFGEGQKEDIFEVDAMGVPQIPRPPFILVAPYAEDFCEKYINKTFHNDKMTVTSCELLKKSENTVGGTILGKYQLVTIETWSNSQDDAHVDLRTTFLQEQNGPDVGCKYNGYWAPVQLLFRGTMEDFNMFLENSNGKIEEITETN